MELPYDPAIPLLDIYRKNSKTCICKDIYTPMLIATLFTVAKTWRQPKCLSIEDWITTMWFICTMEYYSAIRKDKILPFVTTWTDLENIMPSEPWLVWFSGLSASLWTKRSQVRFPVRAHAWVVGQVPGWQLTRDNHTLVFLFLSFSIPSPLSKNKFKKENIDIMRSEISQSEKAKNHIVSLIYGI